MSTEIKTPNLEEIAANYKKLVGQVKRRIIICGGTGCIANGSMKVRDAICAELETWRQKKESQEAQARYNARLYYKKWEPDEEE